jgi:CRP-like cAMP-binding protein
VAELAGIETVMLLQSADLFAHCRAEETLRIAGIAKERRFASGETIYERNAVPEALYCVVRGEVAVTGENGEARTVGPLTTFGVEEILSGRLRSARATASADTLVLAIDAEDFFDLLANNVEIVKALFRHLMTSGRPA